MPSSLICMRMLTNFALIAAMFTSTFGCIAVPIPTPEWGEEVIGPEQRNELRNGVGRLSNLDVERILGAPQREFASGRILVYEWFRSQGVWIVGVANTGDVVAGESQHRLVLRFSSKHILTEVVHIDSAMFGAEPRVRSQVEQWLADISREGTEKNLATVVDIERFRAPTPHSRYDPIGILIDLQDDPDEHCLARAREVFGRQYSVFSIDDLRSKFFPWFEPNWYSNIEEIATAPELEQSRQATNLRFIVIGASDGRVYPAFLCSKSSNYLIACAESEFGSHRIRFLALDLQEYRETDEITGYSGRTIFIPSLPQKGKEDCRLQIAYAANLISGLVN